MNAIRYKGSRVSQLPLAALVVACCSFNANAQGCKHPETQLAMNRCAARDYREEDTRLNKTYRALMSKLEEVRRDSLRQVQVAWLKFRDLQCDLSSSGYDGGSMYPMERLSCLIEMTRERNQDLMSMLKEAGH